MQVLHEKCIMSAVKAKGGDKMHIPVFFMTVEWGLAGLKDVINVHPLFVHSPIGLLLAAFAFYFLGSIFKKDELLAAGKWTLYLGTFAAALTVWTGLQAEGTVPHGYDVHQILLLHKYIGFAVLALSAALSAWVFFSKTLVPSKGKPVFLAGLALLAIVLTQGADLGGRMVFLHGVGVGRKSMMMQEITPHARDHHEHGGKDHAGEEPV